MKGGFLARGVPHSACQIILLVGISYPESGQLPSATEFDFSLFLLCAHSNITKDKMILKSEESICPMEKPLALIHG